MVTNPYDLNSASKQRSFDVIPSGTIVNVRLTLRMHLDGADSSGCLSPSKDGLSKGLDCEFEVLDGEFAKRKFWNRFTITGTKPSHEEAGEISRGTLRAIVESARGIRPDDQSEAAQKGRLISDWFDFNDLCFMARVKVRPAQDNFPARNELGMIITPDLQMWRPVAQVSKPKAATETATGNGSASSTGTSSPATAMATNAPAGAAAVPARPNWAK